jgi:hypothetical protein
MSNLFGDFFDGDFNDTDITWGGTWEGMPEYNNSRQPSPEITATFKFKNKDDYEDFKEKIKKHLYNGEKVFDGMQKKDKKQAWYPLKEKASKYTCINKSNTDVSNPRFPLYIVSKGRWNRNPTSKALIKMGVPFYMVVEEQEYERYCSLVGKENVLILPKKYQKEYDVFWDDDDPRTGPGPARNFAWEHSMDNGFDWHWVMDDNIESIERFINNLKIKCNNGTPFYVCEDYVLRYKNIAQAGLNYSIFCPANEGRPPIKFNTRIYSCLLIRNDIPYRWRGRYNEDTDLSLRILKDGWCTVQFNAFLQGKRATQTVNGGNSAEFYDEEGTLKKSKMLEDMHPDVAKVSWRFNRWHHSVNYKPFANNELILKDDIDICTGINNFGMSIELNK